MMNENAQKLYDWLMAGAPHAIFDMEYDMKNVDDMSKEYVEHMKEVQGETDCGTVCCIAGAAYQMSTTPDGSFPENMPPELGMNEIMMRGGIWLGFETHTGRDYWHDLFDPNLAPSECTPQMAAAALKRACEGLDPWPNSLWSR